MSIFGGGELSRYGVHIIGAAVCGDAPDRCELDRPRGAADNQIARVHFVNAAAHKATLCHTGQKTDQDCVSSSLDEVMVPDRRWPSMRSSVSSCQSRVT